MPTTGNKLHLRCTNSLQPYANKAQQFLILILDLRNKVNLVSQELDCEFNYDLSPILRTFANSFKTSLHDDMLAT